ncbi:MAG: hypothetical protein J5795_02995 [Lachnospiraceae bacterium]|nr:hypothetical protein [Lachnospiraceae bacterium]
MKKLFSKKVYVDVLRRTRTIRILSVVLSILLCVCYYDSAHEDAESYMEYIKRIPFLFYASFVIGFILIVQDLCIHRFHRNRRCELFYTLPVSKKQWFWSTALVSITNLGVLVILIQAAEEVLIRFVYAHRLGAQAVNHIPTPIFRQMFLLFAVGLVTYAVIALVREMTHGKAAFFAVLIGTTISFWMGMFLYSFMKELYSDEFGYNPNSWAYRIRLFFRIWDTRNPNGLDDLAVCYDTFAILLNIVLAVGILYLGSRIAERSRAEYVGAEYRNKKLFLVLVSLTNLVPLLFVVMTNSVGDEKLEARTTAFLVLLVILTVVLFCRLFREKSVKKIAYCLIFTAVLFGGILGLAKVVTRIESRVPSRDKIVAVSQWDYFFTDPEAIDKAYAEILNRKDALEAGDDSSGYIWYTVYTKTGVREYRVSGAGGLMKNEANYYTEEPAFPCDNVLLNYGREPILISEFADRNDLEEFLKQLPEEYRVEQDVYYHNFLGGISKAKKPLINVSGSEDLLSYTTMYLGCCGTNYKTDSSVAYRPGSDAMKMVIEKIQLPHWKSVTEQLKSGGRVIHVSYWRFTEEKHWRGSFRAWCENGIINKEGEDAPLAEYINNLIEHPEEYIAEGEDVMQIAIWWDLENYSAECKLYVSADKAKVLLDRAKVAEWPKTEEEEE